MVDKKQKSLFISSFVSLTSRETILFYAFQSLFFFSPQNGSDSLSIFPT